MMQKHKAINYGSIFIFGIIVVPVFCFGLSMIPGNGPGRIVMWTVLGFLLITCIVFFRKPMLLSFARVIIDEEGITAKVPFRKNVTMRWDILKRIQFGNLYTKGNLYNQEWFCFISEEGEFSPNIKSLNDLPYPNEHCIYMVYSEFVWEMITKYADRKSYNEAIYRSREKV